jgi:hypothetical protein
MAVLGGGIIALLLGIIGLFAWWGDFLEVLKGSVPIMLILGGALATYLGYEEYKDKQAMESITETEEDLKQEVERLKKEIEELKSKKEEGKEEKKEE